MASLKTKLAKAFPVFSKLLKPGRTVPLVKQTIITATAGAGNKTVTGLLVDDELCGVINLTASTDITSTCSIAADGSMYTSSAVSASDKLLITYLAWDDRR